MALKSPGGHDYKFVDSPPKSLECSICLFIVHNPHVTSCCGNHFCRSCINPIQRDNKPCPLCNDPRFTTFLHKGVAREVNALKIYCPNKPQGCDWQGELGQVEKHLNPEDESKGCGFVMVECKYKCGVWVRKRLVKKHETETCRKRPSGEASDTALLIKKLSSEIQALKTESRRTKSEMSEIRAELSALKAENSTLKRLIELRPLPPVPPIYFSIHDYEHCYQEVDSAFFSPPFYSHHGGYKLQFQIFPNGSIGYEAYMSVYLCTMMGEYDDKLRWPFKVQVAIEMFNCIRKKWTKIHCINDTVTDRPVECVALGGAGIHRFMSLSRLTDEYVQKNSSIRFCVTRVQLS